MLTTANLIIFLQLREGFRKHAYDDAKPNVRLTAETEIEGTITIGYGTTRYPDGRPVEWDDKVTKSEASDYLTHYVSETIEPAIEQIIHRPLAPCQYDAIGSCIYQYGEGEVEGWQLIRLINDPGTSWKDIAKEWINGTVMWRGEPLFWTRRISELFMFFGLDWMAGDNVPVLSDVENAIQLMGFDGEMPTPVVESPDPALFEDPDLVIKTRGAVESPEPKAETVMKELPPVGTDPTPDTPWTGMDRQYDGARAVGYEGSYADFQTHRTVVTKRNAIVAPQIDVKKEPKAVEDSETGRGHAKEVSGKDDVRIGAILSGSATVAATASALSKDLSVATENTRTMVGGLTGTQLIWVGLMIGIPLLIYGLWKMHRGKQIKDDGRADATQLKV